MGRCLIFLKRKNFKMSNMLIFSNYLFVKHTNFAWNHECFIIFGYKGYLTICLVSSSFILELLHVQINEKNKTTISWFFGKTISELFKKGSFSNWPVIISIYLSFWLVCHTFMQKYCKYQNSCMKTVWNNFNLQCLVQEISQILHHIACW